MTSQTHSATYIVGIDPGINGAIAILESRPHEIRVLEVFDLPQATVNKRQELQLAEITRLLRSNLPAETIPQVYIEAVHAAPKQGVVSMFRFGYAAGALAGIVSALNYPLTFLTPQRWQLAVRCARDPDAGRQRASQLFPDAVAALGRKKDHNRADAILIGYAGIILGH